MEESLGSEQTHFVKGAVQSLGLQAESGWAGPFIVLLSQRSKWRVKSWDTKRIPVMGDNGNEKRNAKDIECISWVVVLLFNLTTDKRCLLETNYHSYFNLHPSVNFKQTSFTLLHTSNKSSIIDIFLYHNMPFLHLLWVATQAVFGLQYMNANHL